MGELIRQDEPHPLTRVCSLSQLHALAICKGRVNPRRAVAHDETHAAEKPAENVVASTLTGAMYLDLH
jgi:hypothetical protein